MNIPAACALVVWVCAAVVQAQPVPLSFRPIDVQYSSALDRLIMISADPSELHIVNPATGGDIAVSLPLTPLSLSVGPDGTHAAVGYDAWVGYINLGTAAIEKNLAVAAIANVVVLAGNGYIYIPPTTSVSLATGASVTSSFPLWNAYKPALHPNGKWIYYTHGGFPDDVVKADISNGAFQYLYDSPYHGSYPVCAGIWYTEDAQRLITGCATLFRTDGQQSADLRYNGALSGTRRIQSATHSLSSHKIAVIPDIRDYNPPSNTADSQIQFYDDAYPALLGRIPLPAVNTLVPYHGRYLFYTPDATHLYVVLQADITSGFSNDYALYTLSLGSGASCGVVLASGSADVSEAGGDASVNVTATDGCVWQSSTSATWLNIGEGAISSGPGIVKITVSPNIQTISRSATVIVGGQTYTVTQAGAAAPGVDPTFALPFRPEDAEYTSALDRIVAVSSFPNAVHIFNPVTRDDRTVPLPLPPTAVSVSPDGLRAAIGHDGWISYVDLSTGSVLRNYPVTTTVFDVVLTNLEIYAFPLHDQWTPVHVINLASGAETLWIDVYAGTVSGRLHPNGRYLYLNTAERFDVSAGVPASGYSVLTDECPGQWFSQDGQRIFSACGEVKRVSDLSSQDLQYNGQLWSNTTSRTAAVADSSAQGLTAAVQVNPFLNSGAEDTSIHFFSRAFLADQGSLPLPNFQAGASSFSAHARFLFWNRDSDRLFAITQADPASGLLNDFELYTISLNGACNVSLANRSANVGDATSTASVSVSATAGCVWRASSNASWISLTQNTVAAGNAIVWYSLDPNLTTSARTGTLTIGGQTYSITQAAGSPSNASPMNVLPFRIVDAEYSKTLDRIVAVSAGPNRLNIYDPVLRSNVTVNLPKAPVAVAVSPDGLHAVVAADGLLTIVDLQNATVEKNLDVSINPADVIFAGNGYVYAVAIGYALSSVDTNYGIETKLYSSAGIHWRLHPNGRSIYAADSFLARFSTTSGPLTPLYYTSNATACMDLWFTDDARVITRCGRVYRTSQVEAEDLTYAGTLSGIAPTIASASHSAKLGLIASTSEVDWTNPDGQLYLNDDQFLALAGRMTLPRVPAGTTAASSRGKWVFWNSASDRLFVVVQADPAAGLLNDFAVYTFAPSSTPGCTLSLAANAVSVAAARSTGNLAVNGDSSCIWQATSSVGWISVDSGKLGVGLGNVGYTVVANHLPTPRTATISVNGQTFTINQAAGTRGVSSIGTFRSGFLWLLDSDGDHHFSTPPDAVIPFGGARGDIPITGDWNGDGRTKVGVYRPIYLTFVLDYNGDGQFGPGETTFLFPDYDPDVVPVTGDWNGDGRTEVGVVRAGYLWILDTNGDHKLDAGDDVFAFGAPGDIPITGDWDGSGKTKVGVFRSGYLWILDVNGNHVFDAGDVAFPFGGIHGDVPVVGDWNGDGRSKVGIRRLGFFWLLDENGNHLFDYGSDPAFPFGGVPGDRPVSGVW